MTEDLDQIKSDPSCLRIYGSFLKLRKTGDKYVGLCPLPTHSDKTPSFTVFSDMRWHCFGCGAAGNIFQLVESVEGIGFKEAVAKVKKNQVRYRAVLTN